MFERRSFRILRSLGRSREIATVLLNYGFGDVVERLGLLRYIQWGRRILSRPNTPQTLLTRPQRIRLALEALGPTFIKFGQVLSTRPDLVPPDLICELTKLQEGVPSFPVEKAIETLESELGNQVDRLFLHFERQPLAAGSLGQVHRAQLFDGTPLAVKIRRPNVVREVERDLELMLELAILIERHVPESRVFEPTGLVSQFARSIRREMNFIREARTIDEFSRLFKKDQTLTVPKVYWELSGEAIITMSYLDGFKVSDRPGMLSAGLKREELAANGGKIFLKQVFEFGLFHGDPHPGNVRMMPNGSIGLIDFGMVGRLEDERREELVDIFLSISQRDVKRAVELVLTVGRPSEDIDRGLLQSDVRDFIETYYGLALERVKMGKLLSDFVLILSSHSIRFPADLMLLLRAMITLDGLGRDLDPEFNLAVYLAPFIKKLIRDRYSPHRIAHRMLGSSGRVLEALQDVPIQIEKTLQKLNRDEIKILMEHRGLDYLVTELDRSGNRIVVGMVMSSLILASALIVRTSSFNSPWFPATAFVLSSLLGAWLVYGIFRSGRL